MPRWSAERRAGPRHWRVGRGAPGIGPTARRAIGCGVPRPAPVGAPLPSFARGSCEGRRTRRLTKKYGQRSVGYSPLPHSLFPHDLAEQEHRTMMIVFLALLG